MTKVDQSFELTIRLRVTAENLADAVGCIEARLTSGRTDPALPLTDSRGVMLVEIKGKGARG